MHKILFYSPDAASLFDPSIKEPIGGAELRAFNFATYLSTIGNTVSFIVNKLSSKRIVIKKIEVVPINYFKKHKSFFFKIRERICYRIRYKSLISYEFFLRNSEFFFIKPAFVCAFGLTNNTHHACKLAKSINAGFILFIASDEEINFNETRRNTKLDTSFKQAGDLLHASDSIFVQNSHQKQMLQEVFNVKATLILNPIDLEQKFIIKEDFVLWVGKSSSYKNPLIFRELCALFPSQQFLMVCNKADGVLFDEVRNNRPPNCRLVEHVKPEEIESYFAACKLFINTSDFEGFPNTFLQAAKYGKPIISYKVDPNYFISGSDCGFVCHGDLAMLRESLNFLLTDRVGYEQKAKNALAGVQKHSIEEVGQVLMEAFK